MEYKTKTPRKTMSAPPVRWKKRVEDAMDNDDGEAVAAAAAATTDDIEDTSPKRNWKVKRILSNDSFKRENPGSIPAEDGIDDDSSSSEKEVEQETKAN